MSACTVFWNESYTIAQYDFLRSTFRRADGRAMALGVISGDSAVAPQEVVVFVASVVGGKNWGSSDRRTTAAGSSVVDLRVSGKNFMNNPVSAVASSSLSTTTWK